MTLEDFKEAFKKFTIVYLNKDWKNSFIEKEMLSIKEYIDLILL